MITNTMDYQCYVLGISIWLVKIEVKKFFKNLFK